MPHRPCLLEANQAYHVTWKVQNDEFRLVHDADVKVLEALMVIYLMAHDLKITAFSIMSNHVHLIIENDPKDHETLFKWIRDVKREFAKYYNIAYGRNGNFWKRGFDARLIADQEYYHMVTAYILNNPVKARRCRSPEQFAFASFFQVMNGEEILSFQQGNRFMAADEARQMVSQAKAIPYASRLPQEAQAARGLHWQLSSEELKLKAREGQGDFKRRGPQGYWHPHDPQCTINTVNRFLCHSIVAPSRLIGPIDPEYLKHLCQAMINLDESQPNHVQGCRILFESCSRKACYKYQERFTQNLPEGALRKDSIVQTGRNTWALIARRGRRQSLN